MTSYRSGDHLYTLEGCDFAKLSSYIADLRVWRRATSE
jgi:hypothetical protein